MHRSSNTKAGVVVSITEARSPLLRNACHFFEDILLARSGTFQRLETMVRGVKEMQGCLVSESLAYGPKQFKFRKFVTRSSQKQQGDINVVEVVGAVRCTLSGRMQWETKKDKASHILDWLL